MTKLSNYFLKRISIKQKNQRFSKNLNFYFIFNNSLLFERSQHQLNFIFNYFGSCLYLLSEPYEISQTLIKCSRLIKFREHKNVCNTALSFFQVFTFYFFKLTFFMARFVVFFTLITKQIKLKIGIT